MEGCKLRIVFSLSRASSGIGLSTAIALSDRGAQVALLARSTDALQELAQTHRDRYLGRHPRLDHLEFAVSEIHHGPIG
jgi:NADP-dependent 3-hydroxy acid dehydrogenase YdfG